ncbi:MAG: hypothetical protein AB7V04_07605, partial [Desulfomonilaceae bacterium]
MKSNADHTGSIIYKRGALSGSFFNVAQSLGNSSSNKKLERKMECHCKDHLPGSWHSHDDCDCHKNDHPTYSFVITKVMEQDPGSRTVFISSSFMEKLQLEDGDPVEIVDAGGCIAQAKPHPNAWIDTRMVSLDKMTMDENKFQLYSQVKIRKAVCPESELVTLVAPPGCQLSRPQLSGMLEKLSGAV